MVEQRERVMWVFALAVVASLSVHLPMWGALGVLAKWWDDRPLAAAPPASSGVELSMDELPDDQFVELDPLESTDDEEPEEPPVEDDAPELPPEPEPEVVEPEPEPEPEPEREATPPPEDAMNRRAVQQRSQDPTVETPENAEYVARENNRVEEETVAEVRSLDQDSPETSMGEPLESSEADEQGNADSLEIQESDETEGEESSTTSAEEMAGTPRPTAPTPRSQDAREERSGGQEPEMETVTISDGFGTFTVRRPVAEGTGGGESGGEQQRARRRRNGSRSGRGRREGDGPDLRISWNQFEQVYGEDQLQQEREAYVEERLTRIRGNGQRQRRWADFRAAIENYIPGVRPGNQTALNAAASPYADYIATIHRSIHQEFAVRFIGGLPSAGSNPMADQSLVTKLEIIFNADGSLHRVGVVRSSGLLPFDFGSFDAVMRGQPYPTPPDAIKSGDGRVYLHWAFHRNGRQCGTWNAEPYILPNPPGSPRRREGLIDGLQQDSVVPAEASPTWGTDGDESGEEPESPEEGSPESPPTQEGNPEESARLVLPDRIRVSFS